MMNEKTPVLSVIVPVYNAERYLKKCIDSIINQTFRDLEIILVDDGSTDNSLEICQECQRMDRRIKIISKGNGGLIRARKSGLSAAEGNYIGFVDSDDWIESTMYETLVSCMEDTGGDLVSSGIVREFEGLDRQMVIYDNYAEGIYRNLEHTIYPTMLYHPIYRNYGIYCNLVNKLYKRKLLEQVYMEISEEVFYGEDALTCYPYCLIARSIFVLHKAFYHYNIRDFSMASAPDERLPYNNYLLYHNLRNIFLKSDCSWALMYQLKKYLMYLERHNLFALYQFDVVSLDKWYFSYPKELYDKRFVLYGAGVCGQAHYRQLCEMGKEQNMVSWVDIKAEKRAEECAYPISYPKVLLQVEWDIILVSVQSERLAAEIIIELSETYYIEKSRIFWSSVEHVPVWDIY